MSEPEVSAFAERLYGRLPEVYRRMDIEQVWLLKRYLAAATHTAGEIETVVERARGSRPAGPASPAPWGLVSDEELTRWAQARTALPSELGDPLLADDAWLPWLAQLVGARLDPAASEAERRDTIRYATSGWRAGSRAAIADAARSALTGTQYAQVLVHSTVSGGMVVAGSPWDITIVTRDSETPDPDAVLGAVLRKGVKPAGAVLHHHPYTTSWTAATAAYPTWADRGGTSWREIEETGLG